MWIELLAIVTGAAVLTWSAERFVVGASVTARHLGVPTLIIGLTVVGFGTSAPELIVSAIAAWEGNPGISVGNAIGSNIANIGLILGATAIGHPLLVRSRILHQELPLLLASMGLSLILLWNQDLSRMDGCLLLASLFLLLLWLGWLGRERGVTADLIGLEFADEIPLGIPLWRALLNVLIGLLLLLASSRLLVWAAISVARALGVSDLVIGLTIVALGTSLPELAASMASARKGEHDIAIGNIIGSNMFNLLGVMGLAGIIAPYHIEAMTLQRDFTVMAALTIAFFIMAYGFSGQGRISRIEGVALVLAYLCYQATLYMQS